VAREGRGFIRYWTATEQMARKKQYLFGFRPLINYLVSVPHLKSEFAKPLSFFLWRKDEY